MSRTINSDEIVDEIRRVNSEEKAPCLSFRLFFEKQKLALTRKAILRPFDGKWSLACQRAGVTPGEARDIKHLKRREYSKEQIRKKLEQIAHEMPDGITGTGIQSSKELAMTHLLASSKILDPSVMELFRSELEKLRGKQQPITQAEIRPHEHGRMLGFRAFAHVPTYEQDVVGMFTAIADEIGFEIVSNRVQFPDCKANRKTEGSARNRYKECLIEFELRSSDFKAHRHPVSGCDLIVCWEHDWKDCPLEVLELKTKIEKMTGWKK